MAEYKACVKTSSAYIGET